MDLDEQILRRAQDAHEGWMQRYVDWPALYDEPGGEGGF